eukprot:12412090-Karenia_brevis.AAC.1
MSKNSSAGAGAGAMAEAALTLASSTYDNSLSMVPASGCSMSLLVLKTNTMWACNKAIAMKRFSCS